MEKVKIETPDMTIGELSDTIESNTLIVRRSTHVGNQPPNEMAIMAGLPPGVEVLMVDTIQGNDNYSSPHRILRKMGNISLASNKKASGRVVGYCDAVNPYNGEQETLDEIHNGTLERLDLNNKPIAMMKYFKQYPDALDAMIAACMEMDELNRMVCEDGKIVAFDRSQNIDDIYLGGKTTGVMIPLNGMMAFDMLLSQEKGSDKTIHLGGPNMVEYVRDENRMKTVSKLFEHACILMGETPRKHIYSVVDSRGLAVIEEISQHELLENGTVIDLRPYRSKSTGLSA